MILLRCSDLSLLLLELWVATKKWTKNSFGQSTKQNVGEPTGTTGSWWGFLEYLALHAVFWRQFLSDFYGMKRSILIWNQGEFLTCHCSMAKYGVFFLLNCDETPNSEIESLVLKPCNYPRWPKAPNNFKSFTPIHPVKSHPCLQSLHYPIFQVSLSFCSTKYSTSTINNDTNTGHKSKTSREENPFWK